MKNIGKKLFALLLCATLCCSMFSAYAGTASPSWNGRVSTVTEVPAPSVKPHASNSSGGTLGLTVTVAGSETDFRQMQIGINRSTTLKVTATVNDGSAVKYQWYELKESDIDLSTGEFTYKASQAISGATKASYKTPVLTKIENRYFVCVVTDKKGATASAMFIVTAIYDMMMGLSNAPDGVGLVMLGMSIDKGYYYYDGGEPAISKTYVLCTPTKYEIYRKAEGGKWASLKKIAGPGPEGPVWGGSSSPAEYATSYTDKTAKMGTKYAYKVRGYMNEMWSLFSTAQTIVFNPFADVSLDDPSAEYIAWAYNNDVVKGSYIEESNVRLFNPSDPCTRMNFVMILWKMHGKPSVKGSNPFSDVSGTTSVSAVKWAVKKGLVTGTSATTFSPENNLSRINIIMILYKLAGSPKASAESPYEDISGSKTTKAVNWAVSKKIISPVDATHFAPDANCSRALLVEILCKYNKLYKIL